jgi:hypothetical protein
MPLRPVIALMASTRSWSRLMMACQVAEHVGLGIVPIEVRPESSSVRHRRPFSDVDPKLRSRVGVSDKCLSLIGG